MKRQLVVLARWPAPGRCKQRLAGGLGNRRAARIQARLSAHTLGTARAISMRSVSSPAQPTTPGPELVLAISGLAAKAASRWARAMAAPRWVLQGEGPLGVRLQRQITRACREGVQQVVVIGSDLPNLETADLRQAFGALDGQPPGGPDLVLGPARDGGYWLIGLALQGLRRHGGPGAPGQLLAGIPWGTNQVLERTLEEAAGLGLRVALLQERSDVDWPEDLARWR